ncbi:EcsC family protein [Acinetobacter sp. MB5]|uniref:EcsC family protein n=1 Tax=Acinetobacter sp. MB5 TaxID=2069438 RepID=UPI000DCF69EC|nr:EcsC family protein [Acinetobacter sp. MB5]
MPKGDNQHPQSKLNQVLGVAKKLSTSGLKVLNQMNNQQQQSRKAAIAVTSDTNAKTVLLDFDQQDPQHLIRVYFPNISKQFFGKHYDRVNQVAEFLLPVSMDEISEYVFHKLQALAEKISTADRILEQTGAQSLAELSQDVSRSGRISQALTEQNKWIAGIQGALSGATGLFGLGFDIPASLLLALRTIYQTGRAHGFELTEQDQDVVQYIFQQIDLQQIVEKQSILLGLRTLDGLLVDHDFTALQKLLGSTNDDEWLKELLLDDQHEFKWHWMNALPKVSALHQITPLISASVSAMYSWQFIADTGQKAQHVFSIARDYLLQHPEQSLSTLAAYQAAVDQLSQSQKPVQEIELKKDVSVEAVDEAIKPKPQRRPRRTPVKTVTEEVTEKSSETPSKSTATTAPRRRKAVSKSADSS